MNSIPPRPDLARPELDSEDLIRLAHLLSGSLRVECPRCHVTLKPTVANRELRLGSSPDLSAIDPRQPSRPRLVFYCLNCQKITGFVQGERWSTGTDGEASRWNHLEMDEAPRARIMVEEFDLED